MTRPRRGTAARFAGEYGSEQRPAVLIGRSDGSFFELAPREAAGPAGMPPPVPEPRGRRFMEAEVRRYEQRCEAEAVASRSAEIARLEEEGRREGWLRRRYDVDFSFE